MGVALGEVVAGMRLLQKKPFLKQLRLIYRISNVDICSSIEQLVNYLDEIAKGLVTLAGALTEIVLVLTLIPQSSLKGSL